MTTLKALQDWIDETARLTRPDQIRWCNGSDDEYRNLTRLLLDTGGFIELNQETHPGCYLHRSDVADVARVEHLTFVCTAREEEAGPNNNWMAPADARARMRALFEGCMSGRTLYVIPYCMGPIDSPLSSSVSVSRFSTARVGPMRPIRCLNRTFSPCSPKSAASAIARQSTREG